MENISDNKKRQVDILKNIVLLVPTLNEEAGIAKVIAGFKAVGVREIIVADGGSKDRTREIAKKNGATVLAVPRGKGNGFRSCLSQIKINKDKFYVMVDGDATYSPGDIMLFLREFANGAEVVTGSRLNKVRDIRSFVHLIGNHIISLAGSLLYFSWNPDICTGYWGFTGTALQKLKEQLSAERFELEADLFSNTHKLGLRRKGVRIEYSEREGESKLIALDGVKIISKLLVNRFKPAFKKP